MISTAFRPLVTSKLQYSIAAFLIASISLASAQVKTIDTAYPSGGTNSASVVTGDFNNDGVLDMVTINQSTLSFFRGLGGGRFAARVNQPITPGLTQAYAADFNGDGKLDLAIASNALINDAGAIFILLGNGDGTFSQGQNIDLSGYPPYLALADFNGDHIPDIAATVCQSYFDCTIEVFLGQGNGTFTSSATLKGAGGPMVAGDFNADGNQDLFVITKNPYILDLYLGQGNGTFKSPLVAPDGSALALAAGDFFNDRIQSVAVVNSEGAEGSQFYLGLARYKNGAIEYTNGQFITSSHFYETVAVGDINGDFQDDVVLVGNTGYAGEVDYVLGHGDGTFGPLEAFPGYGQIDGSPFVRDLNLDSRHDVGVVWGNFDGTGPGGAYVLLNANATTNCRPPHAVLSVNICAPTSGQTVSNPVTFKGAGNAFNGIAKRMELWIDNKKVGQNLEDQLKVTTTLAPGAHTASFVVVDSFDSYTSKSVTFTVSN
jgi:FG-GAP-like repeat